MKLKTVLSYVPGWSLAAVFVWLLMLAASSLVLVFMPSSMKLLPALCAEGATVEVRESRPRAGKRSVHVDCVDADGTRLTGQELRAVSTLATLLFVPVFLSLFAWAFLRKEAGPAASARLATSLSQATRTPAAKQSPAETLRQLKELLDAGLITPEDYEGKKTEVLSRI